MDRIQAKTKKGRSFNLHSCVMWNFLLLFESLSTGGMAGNILAIVSGVTYAGVFLIKKFPGGDFESSLMVSHLISIVVGIPFLMRETVFTPTVWGYVLVLGIVQFGLSYVFYPED